MGCACFRLEAFRPSGSSIEERPSANPLYSQLNNEIRETEERIRSSPRAGLKVASSMQETEEIKGFELSLLRNELHRIGTEEYQAMQNFQELINQKYGEFDNSAPLNDGVPVKTRPTIHMVDGTVYTGE